MWFTASRGLPRAQARALAVETPMSRAPTKPGPWVTATASMPDQSKSASSKALRIKGFRASRCWREAISGTTPPNRAWVSIWEATWLAKSSRPRLTMATAVSSQDVSIAKILAISLLLSVQVGCDVIQPHYQRVLSVISVIAPTHSRHHKAKPGIELLGSQIAAPHLQGNAIGPLPQGGPK